MSSYLEHLTPTPSYVPPSYPPINIGSAINPALLQANSILHTVELNIEIFKVWGILDSGAPSHFLCLQAPMDDIQVATNPVLVTIPTVPKSVPPMCANLDSHISARKGAAGTRTPP